MLMQTTLSSSDSDGSIKSPGKKVVAKPAEAEHYVLYDEWENYIN